MRNELLVQDMMKIQLFPSVSQGISTEVDLLEFFLGCWLSCCTGATKLKRV